MCYVLFLMTGNAAIREQAAATQLVLAQAPVPNPMLLQEEVLERLLTLCVQLVGCYMPGQAADTPSVPASCISLSTGRMSFTDRGGASVSKGWLVQGRNWTASGQPTDLGLAPLAGSSALLWLLSARHTHGPSHA